MLYKDSTPSRFGTPCEAASDWSLVALPSWPTLSVCLRYEWQASVGKARCAFRPTNIDVAPAALVFKSAPEGIL